MVERFNTLLKEVKEDLIGVVNYSENIIPIVSLLNKSNKGTLGKCRKWRDGRFEIFLNPKLETMSDRLVKDVLAHEIIHTVEGCYNHGYEFKKVMGYVNLNCNNYKIEVRTNSDEWRAGRRYKYKLTCKKCGKVFYRDRLNKGLVRYNLYTHICGGDLEIEKLY